MQPKTATERQVEVTSLFLGQQDRVNDTAVGSDLYNLSLSMGRLAAEIEAETVNEIQKPPAGAALDIEASDAGVSPRKPAQRSSTMLIVQGRPGYVVPSGMLVRTMPTQTLDSQVFSVTQGGTVQASSTPTVLPFVAVPIVAQRAGRSGNVKAGSINTLVLRNDNIFQVFNADDAMDGDDAESDESLRERIALQPELKRGGTIAAIRGALLGLPGIAHVEVLGWRPNPGDCTVVVGDAAGGASVGMLAAAKQVVDPEMNEAAVGVAGMHYFFAPPKRLVLDVTYRVRLTSDFAGPGALARLRDVTVQRTERIRPGQVVTPNLFLAGQDVDGVLSVESVSIVSTSGLEVITGVTITGSKLPDAVTPLLSYVASLRSLAFHGGPPVLFLQSKPARLFGFAGLSYLDVVVNTSLLPQSSASEAITSQTIPAQGFELARDHIAVVGSVTMNQVAP